MDRIIIKNLKVFAYHGVNAEEKIIGQNFLIDAELYLDLTKPCVTDRLTNTVSYSAVIKTITRVFTERKYDLIERAAEVIAVAIKKEYGMVEKVDVTVKKPEAPMKAELDYAAVSITR